MPACADPRRVQAALDLATCQSVANVGKWYRRDDNSGTTDSFREKLRVTRFCNGRARGTVGTFNTTNANLNNQDIDPVRTPCNVSYLLDGVTPRPATQCTNMRTGAFCTPASQTTVCSLDQTTACTPGTPDPCGAFTPSKGTCTVTVKDPDCTQGLVVALSVGDNATDLLDITRSIGDRAGRDSTGTTFGFAGKEAVSVAAIPSAGPVLNNITFDEGSVRADSYLLSRRLFLQRAAANDDTGAPINTTGFGLAGGGGSTQKAAETALWNFMAGVDSLGNSGRCNMEPIVKAAGFITCTPKGQNCFDPIQGTNLCTASPFPPGLGATANCIPSPSAGGGSYIGGAVACAAGDVCCSTGMACPASGTCPAFNSAFASALTLGASSISVGGTGTTATYGSGGTATAPVTTSGRRPAGYACWFNSDCDSNVCADAFGTGYRQCQ
jgi:hypothetical protein